MLAKRGSVIVGAVELFSWPLTLRLFANGSDILDSVRWFRALPFACSGYQSSRLWKSSSALALATVGGYGLCCSIAYRMRHNLSRSKFVFRKCWPEILAPQGLKFRGPATNLPDAV